MEAATIAKIIALIIQAAELGIKYTPALWEKMKKAVNQFFSSTPATAEEIADADATLEMAHAEFQEAVKADEEVDGSHIP